MRRKDGRKTAEECCRARSEEIRKQSIGVDERGQCWQQLEAQANDVECAKNNRKCVSVDEWRALTESVCGRVIGEENTLLGPEARSRRERERITEMYFRVMEMLLSLIRARCCETDWGRSYSPQVPLVSFFSSPFFSSFIFLLPRPLFVRRGKDHAVGCGTWVQIKNKKHLNSKSQ